MGETEIITRRRKWTAEEKAALLAEVEAEGGAWRWLRDGTGYRRARFIIDAR
jgi:hypothetical protein